MSIPKVLTVNNMHMAVFLLSLHFKDNTVCIIEHISFNSVQFQENTHNSAKHNSIHTCTFKVCWNTPVILE